MPRPVPCPQARINRLEPPSRGAPPWTCFRQHLDHCAALTYWLVPPISGRLPFARVFPDHAREIILIVIVAHGVHVLVPQSLVSLRMQFLSCC